MDNKEWDRMVDSYLSCIIDNFSSKEVQLSRSYLEQMLRRVYLEGCEDAVSYSEFPEKLTNATFIEKYFTLTFGSNFKGRDGVERSLAMTGIGDIDTARLACAHFDIKKLMWVKEDGSSELINI